MQDGGMLGLLIFLATKQASPFPISTNNISRSSPKTAKAVARPAPHTYDARAFD